ncbi:MAG: twin-arginine translocation signal domain-containing protein [Pseudomonadota bacterium]
MATTRNPQRRRFLKHLGLGTAAAGAASAVGHVTFVQAESESGRDDTERSTRYRETEHVRTFYATLRD